uniref:At4g21323p-like protein n=1 Tax=Arabidopsis halleri TaxID=81970 RepID=A0A068CLS4_ARAHA|nr:At4g21323p-like protein [Arabidopsis halleri]
MKKTPKMDSSLRLCFVAIVFGFVFIMNGKLSSGTTPHEADPPQASNLAFSPEAAPPDTSAMDDDSDINYEPVPPFVPEFPVFIFYLGERKHDDPNLVTQSHLEILKSVLGSEEAANKSMVYSYHHGFSGFAAKLKPAEAEKLKKHPEVIILLENRKLGLQTTRTWDYLGQFSTPTSSEGLLHETNMGSGAIIGVIDSGIWSESGAFDDDGYGPIPKQWKGQCVSGDQFSPVDCNKKLIGAKYYIDGLNADLETSINSTTEYLSPRDRNGHGTQVSSTVAGSFVSNVTLPGLSSGSIMRGSAPKAHIAMYKTCWDVEGGMCSVADVWKAFDEAIHDGVDILSVSIGGSALKSLDVEIDIAIPALHAVNKGIPVVSPAGNGGSRYSSVINISPWILTVAATTLDRSFPTLITLENNKTFLGQSLYTGPEISFTDLICTADHSNLDQITKGKVIMHFSMGPTPPMTPDIVQKNGGIGLIDVRSPSDSRVECPANFPCIYVDLEVGSELYTYIQTTSSLKIKISPYKTIFGERVASKVAKSSARGPSSFSPAILKPDIAAPGVTLLTPRIPTDEDTSEFAYSGTSMATPVIAGIVALLKISHPNWSPAAIKSALVTTAMKTDPYGERLTVDGGNYKVADAFDYGGGLVNLEKATDPGLVYDMDINDYIHYLCSQALYTDKKVSALTGNVTSKCPSSGSSILDLNVPSITIPDLKRNVTVTRSVTNVGPVKSVYKPVIETPLGFKVVVSPKKLKFNKRRNKVAFKVRVSPGSHRVNTAFFFGSLTWSDGLHNVTIPISLRTRFIDNLFL